jgi:hypothetical protein
VTSEMVASSAEGLVRCGRVAIDAKMAAVAAVLEALILIPREGHPGQLPVEAAVVDLDVEGVHLIPLTEAARAGCQRADGDAATVEGFYELPNGVARWARELSREWVVLYVHLEFFGGEGFHAAIAWDQERVIFGPRFTRTPGETAEPHYQEVNRQGMAINLALRALGLRTRDGRDEFATLGLGKYRRTSDWVA